MKYSHPFLFHSPTFFDCFFKYIHLYIDNYQCVLYTYIDDYEYEVKI